MRLNGEGKTPADYVDEASSPLKRDQFELDLRGFLRQHSSRLNLSGDHVQVLFEISDEYCRNYNAIFTMKKDRLARDWKQRQRLMNAILKKLDKFRESLEGTTSELQGPSTALFARSVAKRLIQVRTQLRDEFEEIKHSEQLDRGMLKALSIKTLHTCYVAELNHYTEKVAFPDVKQKERDVLLAATKLAAQVFTAGEKRGDIVGPIPMARSRAKEFIRREFRNPDDGPVFRTKPKRSRAEATLHGRAAT
jgi:hypothetical protein